MELIYELLLTAAVTLLAAFLLASAFGANDLLPEPDRAAAAIGEEVAMVQAAEEKIIEVDEVKVSERSIAGVTAAAEEEEAEGWIEVEKVPMLVVEECLPEPDKKGAPVKATPGALFGAVPVEEKERDAAEHLDLTAPATATRVVVEADPHALGAEAVLREVVDVVGLEEEKVQDVGVRQRDLGADAAPSEVLDARSDKQGVEVVQAAEVLPLKSDDAVEEHHPVSEVAEVLPLKSEAVEVNQHRLVAEVAPAEVLDAGLEEEKSVQAIEVRSDELAADTAPEILDVVSENKEEQTVDVKEHKLAAEAATQATLDVPWGEKEEVQDQQPAEEAVDVHEEVHSKEEVKCEAHPVDQQEESIPEKELLATKTDDVEVSHEDKVVTELPVEEVTLQGLPEDSAGTDMDFGEWEGIERSEVEKRFGAAAAFAASDTGSAALSKLDSDVQLQLQGLLKVAIDGPCYDSTPPLTLRHSSRAKWVAWQKLGNMHPEIAMEKYMNLLSETIPGWLVNETSDTKKHEAGAYIEAPILPVTAATDQQSNEGNEDSTSIDEGRLTASPNPEKGQSSDVPAE